MEKGIIFLLTLFAFSLEACAKEQQLPYGADMGPTPVLVDPGSSLVPTVNVAEATGWPSGRIPIAAPGFKVQAFATNLEHPRWIYSLPNGDVLVAETNAPPKPDDGKGVKGWFMKKFMKKAGAGTQSANQITLLRDTDNNGVAETRKIFLQGLNSPFGMTLIGNNFYVANTDSVMRFPYKSGQMQITKQGIKIADLPGGRLNHHWTKSLIASLDGKYLYVGIGSNSNAGENGLDKEEGRAAIEEINLETEQTRIFASGLRNPVGLAWQPESHSLWTSVNERDELGDNLVPDYMTSVKEGAFYGWPYSYYGQHIDKRVKPQRPDLVAKAIPPDYALGAHTASLGLTFYDAKLFPQHYWNGAFVGQHGSWNRSQPAGYKVIFIPFANGMPAGKPEDILTGFRKNRNAYGRPVGVAIDKQGALLIADDVGNVIWRVRPENKP